MSRAKAQRLLSEILTLFDGPPSVAVQGLIAVLAGRGLLLAPRGHHFENLANSVAWSFNGVIRKIPSGAPLDTATLMEGGQLPHVLLLEGVDTGRLVKLRATLRKLTEPDRPKPELLFFVATADPAEIPALGHPDRQVWDELFGLRVNGRDSVQRGPTVLADLEPDTLGVEAILPEDILELRRDVAAVPLQENLEGALERIPTLLVAEGWSRLPPSAPQDLGIAARAVAFLRGKPEVNLSHVADVLHPALTARLSSGDSSSTELIDAVEIVWDEAAGQGDPEHPRVPQRKTFVGVEGSLEGASAGAASVSGEETLADVSTDPLVTAPVLASSQARPKTTPPTASTSASAEEGDTWVGAVRPVPTVARPRHGKDSAAEAPQAIHDAYYVPPASYKAPTFGAEAGEDETAESAASVEGAAKPRSRRRSWWPTLVSAGLLGAIAVLGTMLFPNWPFQLYGVGMAISAQGKLWAGQYADAQTTALAALEKLGPRNPLAQRVETIAFLARHELVEETRRSRETAAREAYHARQFDAAAAAFEALGQEFPDHPRYSQLAAQARWAAQEEAARGAGQSEPAALLPEAAGGDSGTSPSSGTPQAQSAGKVTAAANQAQRAESTEAQSSAQSSGSAPAHETPGAATPVQ